MVASLKDWEQKSGEILTSFEFVEAADPEVEPEQRWSVIHTYTSTLLTVRTICPC